MREHVRGSERYFRTEAGALTLDWGSNGADYRKLDFSYVATGKGGNLRKIYGQIQRNADGETYDSYDIMAGRCRRKTSGSPTIEAAIKAHIKSETGDEAKGLTLEGRVPTVPNSIRTEMIQVLMEAIKGWDGCLQGESKEWSEEKKTKIRQSFVNRVWDCGRFYCDSVASKSCIRAVGLLNVEVGTYSELYKRWRGECASETSSKD